MISSLIRMTPVPGITSPSRMCVSRQSFVWGRSVASRTFDVWDPLPIILCGKLDEMPLPLVDPYVLLLLCGSLKFTPGSLPGFPEFGSPVFDPLLLPSSPSNLFMIAWVRLSIIALSSCQESQQYALVEFSSSPCHLSIVTLFAQLPSSFATSSWPSVKPFSPSIFFRFC